jgi:hypothetical protein
MLTVRRASLMVMVMVPSSALQKSVVGSAIAGWLAASVKANPTDVLRMRSLPNRVYCQCVTRDSSGHR